MYLKEDGKKRDGYTVVQSGFASVALGALGVWIFRNMHNKKTNAHIGLDGVLYSAYIIGIGAASLLAISKIWEIIDTWILPSSIQVISSRQQKGLYIAPTLYSHKNTTISPGIRLQFNF